MSDPGRTQTRLEDMSPNGKLTLHQQDDGDVVVTVMDENGRTVAVEFCMSGGRSPRTLAGLFALLCAMAEDNADERVAHGRSARHAYALR